MAELQVCERQDHGRPAGEDFKDVPLDVPQRLFELLTPLMIHGVAVLVDGRPGVITRCRTAGRSRESSIPCAVSGRYLQAAAGAATAPGSPE